MILRLGHEAYGVQIARELEECAGRRVTRGALYATLDRLESKGLVRWRLAQGTTARDGLPRRAYTITASGLTSLRASRDVLRRLWHGVEHLLKGPTT